MAYRRRTRTYRRRTRRTRRPSRGKIYATAGKQLWRDVQKLKNLINVEFKSVNGITNSTVSTTPTVMYHSAIGAGDDINQRGGRQVRLKSIQMEGYFTNITAANTHLRLLAVIAKDWNGAASLTIADLLDSSTGAPIVSQVRNLSNRKQFVILKDYHFTLNSAERTNRRFKCYIPLDMKVVYSGTGSANTDVESNMIMCVLVSDQVGASSPGVVLNNRIRFIDN